MTLPRQVLPGKVVMIGRRCLERRFLLQPSPIVNQVFDYLLAIGCKRFAVGPVSDVAMSNHHHLVANDHQGRHPELTAFFHAQLAKVVNGIRGRSDVFWEGGAPAVTELADAEAVLDAAAYTLANPTKAGLVAHGWEWVGARSAPDAVLRRVRVKRPKLRYFRGRKWPKVVELRYEVPLTHMHLSAEAWAELLRERTEALEAAAREALAAEGRVILGPERVRRRRWTDRAESEAGSRRARTLKPLVKARDARVRRAVLERIAAFRTAYAAALQAFIAGVRAVVFPAGTYQMVARYAVACHSPP